MSARSYCQACGVWLAVGESCIIPGHVTTPKSAYNAFPIHIRTQPDNACSKPAWCGATNGRTITDAWGYYGPSGDGWADVCKACVAAKAKS